MRTRTLRRTAVLGAGLAWLLVLSGCGGAVRGTWKMYKSEPNKDIFAIDNATFARDGTFEATITYEGKTAREAGTYTFNGYKLILLPNAGGQRAFNATVMGRTLKITQGERKAYLKKE